MPLLSEDLSCRSLASVDLFSLLGNAQVQGAWQSGLKEALWAPCSPPSGPGEVLGVRSHLDLTVVWSLPSSPGDIRNLLVWIKKNLLKERPELFIQGDSV